MLTDKKTTASQDAPATPPMELRFVKFLEGSDAKEVQRDINAVIFMVVQSETFENLARHERGDSIRSLQRLSELVEDLEAMCAK